MNTPTPTPHHHLKQKQFLFGSREFIIKGNDTLVVKENSLAKHHETQLPIRLMQATPTQSASFATKWLLFSLFAGTLSALVYYWAIQQGLLILYVLTCILFGTTLVLLYRFFLYTTRLTVFRHVSSNEGFLYLWHNKPDKKQFEEFVDTLSQLIQAQHSAAINQQASQPARPVLPAAPR